MKIKLNLQPQNIFLILGLVYGIAFLLFLPPLQVPDEYAHFYKAYSISDGQLMPEKIGNKAGVYVPVDLRNTSEIIQEKMKLLVKEKQKLDMPFIFKESPIDNNNKVFVDFSKIAVVTYSPLPYLMPALSTAIGKLFNLPPLILIYTAGFVNLVLWLFLIYLSIKITPVFKWGFLVIALLPMTLFESASVSADSLTIGLSFITIALFLRLSLDDRIKKIYLKDVIVLFLVILALSLTKMPYFLLSFLFLMIPADKFGNNKKKIIIFALILSTIFIVALIWLFITKGLYVTEKGVSIHDQLLFILPHPLLFLQLIWNDLVTNPLKYFKIMVGTNWVSYPLPKSVYYAVISLLLFLPFLDKNDIKIDFKKKSIIIGTFLLITGFIYLFDYLTWTPVGLNKIIGVQGRYFIPVLPLLFLLFYNNKFKSKDNILKPITVVSIILILTVTVLFFIGEYYIDLNFI